MRLRRHVLPACAVAPALVALSSAVDTPAFHPVEKEDVTKRFVSDSSFELDDFSLVVDGEDLGGMLGSYEVAVTTESRIEVTDVYVRVKNGRPTQLRRTFDELNTLVTISMVSEFGGDDQDVEADSKLEGRTVIFSWDDEEGEYDVEYEDGEGDEDLLEKLVEDMDLRALLPPGEVSEGDTWTVELADLGSVVAPGGDLSLRPGEVDMGDLAMWEEAFGGFEDELAEILKGSCVCTYRGVTEHDGARMGQIDVEIEVAATADLSDMLSDIMEAVARQFGGEAPEVSIEAADVNFDFEGTGVLLWNLGAGRMDSFELSGDLVLALDLALEVDIGGDGHGIELSLEMGGNLSHEVETED